MPETRRAIAGVVLARCALTTRMGEGGRRAVSAPTCCEDMPRYPGLGTAIAGVILGFDSHCTLFRPVLPKPNGAPPHNASGGSGRATKVDVG